MNGFKLMADSYRKLIKEGQFAEVDLERTVRVYDFLAECNSKDKAELVDSSAFNDYMNAYFEKSMKNAGLDHETIKNVLSEFHHLLDTVSAEEIIKKYD